MNRIEKFYNNMIEKYGENRLLWVAGVGSGIFSLDMEDITEVAACILPTEEEIYNISSLPYLDAFDIRFLVDGIQFRKSEWTELILSPYKIINPKYKDILNKYLFINKELLYLSNNQEILKNLKQSVKQIIISSFEVSNQEQELIKILTKTELTILKNIIKDFKEEKEGDIKVSQATERYNISTAVFRTLFYKLKDYRVAEIDSRGVKGTHINFKNITTLISLLNEEGK